MSLPAGVRSLFHEYGDRELSLAGDRDLVVGRVLSAGDWASVRWLWRELGDDGIRDYVRRTRARRLSPRQVRLWQVLLGLDEGEVAAWLSDPGRRSWDRRAG